MHPYAVFRSVVRVGSVQPTRITLTSDPTTTSASASNPSPDPGHAPTPFFRAAFRYPFELSRLGRYNLGPSLVGRPAALLGFFAPFAGFIPPIG
jgi:hypothetical protein